MTVQNDVYTRDELTARMRRRQRVRARAVEVECQRVEAIAYQDLLALYLRLSGVRRWQWRDSLANVKSGAPLYQTVAALGRDLVVWPWLLLQATQQVAQLQATIEAGKLRADWRRILFLRTDQWFDIASGGSVGHLHGVIDSLRGLGHSTQVVSTDRLPGVDPQHDFHLCTPAYGAGRNLPRLNEVRYNRQLFPFVTRRWSRWRPDLIYQRYSLGNYTGVWLKHIYRVPYICEYNGSFVWMAQHWEGRRYFHEQLLEAIELLNLYAADVVVVVSRAMLDELTARGVDPAKVLVNPNGVDPKRYSPAVDGSAVRELYQLAGKTVIGFIGTFGRWHGAEVLAEAFGRLLQSEPSYREKLRLLLIGDGVTMPQVQETLAHYNVADCAILTGLVPQAEGPQHLAACDLLVSPHVPNPDGTPFFGSPTKLFEYMAMGKGIVASDLDQIGEILAHEQTAWLVRPGDVAALEAGLKTLVATPTLAQRLGAAARRAVEAEYTWRAHTQRILGKLGERCA